MRKIIIVIISFLYLSLPCIGQTDKSNKKGKVKYESFELEACMIEFQNEYYFISTGFVSGLDSVKLCDICKWACRKRGYAKGPKIEFETRSIIRTEELGWPGLSRHTEYEYEGFLIKYQTAW